MTLAALDLPPPPFVKPLHLKAKLDDQLIQRATAGGAATRTPNPAEKTEAGSRQGNRGGGDGGPNRSASGGGGGGAGDGSSSAVVALANARFATAAGEEQGGGSGGHGGHGGAEPPSKREADQFDPALLSIVQSAQLVVGFHPDQAAEACIDLALSLRVPFAVCPCCVFPRDFPDRQLDGKPVVIYAQLLEYLRRKHPSTRVAALPEFRTNGSDRRTVVYMLGSDYVADCC